MELKPKDLFEKLEFDKILELLEQSCFGELGKELIRAIQPTSDIALIHQQLEEVAAYKLGFDQNDPMPLSAYASIEEELKMLSVIDFVLPEEGLQRINTILLSIRNIFRYFDNDRKRAYPALYTIIREIVFEEQLIHAIEGVIDEEGNIRSDASPGLQKIRKAINSRNRELEKVFRAIVAEYKTKGWLTDSAETLRNGRRVLSVPSEHKRKIRGIIHDESTTGKTAFIEPERVIEINNDIFDLETEERREIYRILKELSGALRPYVPAMDTYQDVLARYDVIHAKGYLATKLSANKPKLVDYSHLGIIKGYHPLLLLKNKEIGKVTVPFTLDLHKPNRILMLSGPNAGGKSITMKSLGLMQMMVQSGMLVPVNEESIFGIFTSIFADIGDQQSIEDDLSTYSSRLKNMREFLEAADERTLVLIDEFGSGTDPKIGGAIAEAILFDLNKRKVFGLITTHYSNLKIFAYKNKGVLNGSMTFDKDTLSPTYQLKVGKPGSSYAFEIAEKSGLSPKVLKYARHKTGKNEKAIDQLLVDLQREKQEVEEKLVVMEQERSKLDKLIKNYEQLHRELEYRRKKFKLEAKEKELQQVGRDNKAFEKLVRELKEEKNLEKAKEMAAQVKEERQQLTQQLDQLKEEIYYEPRKTFTKEGPIKVGDYVKLVSGGATGLVESIVKQKVVVLMGQMRMTVKLRDLQHAKAPLEVQASKSIQTNTFSQNAAFQSKIDIRGMRLEEALGVIENFVDKALISSASHLRIVHGKGNGVLKKAVKQKLREYDVEMEVRHPEPEQGGDGVTLVEIR